MDPPVAVFAPDISVEEAIRVLRELVKATFVTYGYVTEATGRLVGVIVMRELLLARPDQRLHEIMLGSPFWLRPETLLLDAMRLVLNRHYPVYPVCDEEGRLVGLIRGQTLFEAQAIEISAQPGRMVGVEREERLSTPWRQSLSSRHPWLQFNLLTAFLAAGVVGWFQGTIDQIVLLAAFLPVIAGEAGNTGAQALAVTLRGITLGDLDPSRRSTLLLKETSLGLANGALVGVTSGVAMYLFASMQGSPFPLQLGMVAFAAMVFSCAISGVTGALVPLALRRFGVDPATASTILLTTVTDTLSIGLFLGLSAWLLV